MNGNRQHHERIEQGFFGQTHQRAAQERAEGERIARVGQRRSERDQILDFLSAKKSLAGLSRDRDRAGFERALVTPEVGAGRGEQRDVSGAARPHGFVAIANRVTVAQADRLG
jgi:hypothetical protein